MNKIVSIFLLLALIINANAQPDLPQDKRQLCVPTISVMGGCRVVAKDKYPIKQRFRYETGVILGAEFRQNKNIIAFKTGITFEDNLLNEQIGFHALYCNVPVIIEMQFPVKTEKIRLSAGVGGIFEILAKQIGTPPVMYSPGGCYTLSESDYQEEKACFEFLITTAFQYQFHKNISITVGPYAKIPVKKHDYFITPVVGLNATLKFRILRKSA